MEPLISVIVPIYNVEKYLCKCIDSVLAQTYTNLEIILVDDGSPDNCPAICDEYALKEPRIKVVHKENGGLSSARNAGLDIATGDYIGFVDSDDYIAPNMYEILYQKIISNNSQMVVCNCFFVDEFDNILFRYSTLQNETVSGIEATKYLQKKNGINFITCWNRLYKSELFENIRFPLNKLCEDNYIAHSLYFKCKKVSFISDKLYYYVQRKGSILNSGVSVKSFDETEGFFRRIEFLDKKDINDNPQAHFEQFLDSYTHFKLLFYPKTKEEKIRIKEINEMAKSVFLSAYKHCSLKNAVITLLPFSVIRFLMRLFKVMLICILEIKQIYCNFVLLNLPRYDNLGDQAIALSEIQLFKKNKIRVIKVEELFLQFFPEILKYVKKDKTIVIPGGGFIGNLWPENESKYASSVINQFRDNRILVFPQSVTFDLSKESGKKYFEYVSKIYKSHSNLELFVREKRSLDFIEQFLPEINVHLVPDIVLLLETNLPKQSRNGIIFCMRNDHEREVNSVTEIKNEISKVYPELNITELDNLTGKDIMPFSRKKEVIKQLKRFSSAKLVVTDRLHGMIFATITNTPCIAFDNSYGKVSGVYEWIKNNKFVFLCNSVADFRKVTEYLNLNNEYHYNKSSVINSSVSLIKAIKGMK